MSESAVMQRLDRLEQAVQKSGQANKQAEEAQRRASEVTQKLSQNTQALQSARQELAQAVRRADNADQQKSNLAGEVEKLRALLAEAKQSNQQAQATQLEAKQQIQQITQQRDSAEREAASLRAKYAGVDLPKLRADLSNARKVTGTLQGQHNDLKLRVEQLVRERRAMEKLADQRLVTVQVLENKLGELLASRWRQMGQRLHMAMVLPWEEAERQRLVGANTNGHHAG